MGIGRKDEEDFCMAAINYRRKKHKDYDRLIFSLVSHLARFVFGSAVHFAERLSVDSETVFSGCVSDAVPDSGRADQRIRCDDTGNGSRNRAGVTGDEHGILCSGE